MDPEVEPRGFWRERLQAVETLLINGNVPPV